MRRVRDSGVTVRQSAPRPSWDTYARHAARVVLAAVRLQQRTRPRAIPGRLTVYLRRLPTNRQKAAADALREWVIRYFFTPGRKWEPVDGMDVAAMIDDLLGVRVETIVDPALRGAKTRGRWRAPGMTEAREAVRLLRTKRIGPKAACTKVAKMMRVQWDHQNATCEELIACGFFTLERKLYDACRVKSRGAQAR